MFGRLSRRIVLGGMRMMRPGFLRFRVGSGFRVPWTALMEKGLEDEAVFLYQYRFPCQI